MEEIIEQLKEKEFQRLVDEVYLDHTGAALYSNKQLQLSFDDLSKNIYGNPHTLNGSGGNSTRIIDEIRSRILRFFSADQNEYCLIFTSGCTASLKLIGELFPWSNQSKFIYSTESHNSLIGIREYAIQQGASFICLENEDIKNQIEINLNNNNEDASCFHLVGFPAERIKLPFELLEHIHKLRANLKSSRYLTVLDAATYVCHSNLDLSKYHPDFVTLSFYKMFGYPTGIGALIMRKESANFLKKTYFGGGTVAASISSERFHQLRNDFRRFEDGTLPFLSIISLKYGLDILESLGMDNIERYTHSLIQFLFKEMSKIRHWNGVYLCTIFGNHIADDCTKQGPILSFILRRSNGNYIGYHEFEQLASLHNIHIRTGCFCNPGACQKYLHLSSQEVRANLESGHVCWDDKDIIKGKPTGAIRVSLGFISTMKDVKIFLQFLNQYFVEEVSKSLELMPEIMNDLSLSKIIIYPIKSCGRFETDSWEIGNYGFIYDREWVLIDNEGKYLNQKKFPRMCLIKPAINLERSELQLNAPNMETVTIPLSYTPEVPVEISVCGDKCFGFTYQSEVNSWFCKYLNEDCSLVRMNYSIPSRFSGSKLAKLNQRKQNTETFESPQSCISFSNESQFLIVTEESVNELQKRIENPIDASSFRPNLVIKGGFPFQEDDWSEIKIGDVHLKVIGECNRCKMICIDQNTGNIGKEPLLSLSQFRRKNGRVIFGVHAERKEKIEGEFLQVHSKVQVVKLKNKE